MTELPYDQEILDVVDINDIIIGQITHEQAFDITNDGKGYLRAVNAFIINAEGKLWIPTRTAKKRIAPNGLDFSVGEHVMSNESYGDAIVRGFQEELNMTVSLDDLDAFYYRKPTSDDKPYIAMHYLLPCDSDPDYNRSDFTIAEWIFPVELINRLKNGSLGKGSLLEVTEELLHHTS
jgi:isopentenyldiphosphate isomerase